MSIVVEVGAVVEVEVEGSVVDEVVDDDAVVDADVVDDDAVVEDVVVEDVVSSEVVQAWLGVDVVEAPSMVESELVGPADAVVGAVVAVEPEATSVPGSAEGVPQAPATSRNSGRASVHRPVGRDPMRRRSLTSISSRLGERETRDLGPSTPRIQGRR